MYLYMLPSLLHDFTTFQHAQTEIANITWIIFSFNASSDTAVDRCVSVNYNNVMLMLYILQRHIDCKFNSSGTICH